MVGEAGNLQEAVFVAAVAVDVDVEVEVAEAAAAVVAAVEGTWGRFGTGCFQRSSMSSRPTDRLAMSCMVLVRHMEIQRRWSQVVEVAMNAS